MWAKKVVFLHVFIICNWRTCKGVAFVFACYFSNRIAIQKTAVLNQVFFLTLERFVLFLLLKRIKIIQPQLKRINNNRYRKNNLEFLWNLFATFRSYRNCLPIIAHALPLADLLAIKMLTRRTKKSIARTERFWEFLKSICSYCKRFTIVHLTIWLVQYIYIWGLL